MDLVPIKVAEISIKKFNDQIEQKVRSLRNFRVSSNSSKNLNLGDLEKIRKEAINSLRIVKQLKQLMIEINHLKSRTKPEDHEKFDELTKKRRDEALKEIQMYQGEIGQSSNKIILFLVFKEVQKINESLNELKCLQIFILKNS